MHCLQVHTKYKPLYHKITGTPFLLALLITNPYGLIIAGTHHYNNLYWRIFYWCSNCLIIFTSARVYWHTASHIYMYIFLTGTYHCSFFLWCSKCHMRQQLTSIFGACKLIHSQECQGIKYKY